MKERNIYITEKEQPDKKVPDDYWDTNKKYLITLSIENIRKVDEIGKKHNLSRSSVINILLNQLTGKENILLINETDYKSQV